MIKAGTESVPALLLPGISSFFDSFQGNQLIFGEYKNLLCRISVFSIHFMGIRSYLENIKICYVESPFFRQIPEVG